MLAMLVCMICASMAFLGMGWAQYLETDAGCLYITASVVSRLFSSVSGLPRVTHKHR